MNKQGKALHSYKFGPPWHFTRRGGGQLQYLVLGVLEHPPPPTIFPPLIMDHNAIFQSLLESFHSLVCCINWSDIPVVWIFYQKVFTWLVVIYCSIKFGFLGENWKLQQSRFYIKVLFSNNFSKYNSKIKSTLSYLYENKLCFSKVYTIHGILNSNIIYDKIYLTWVSF